MDALRQDRSTPASLVVARRRRALIFLVSVCVAASAASVWAAVVTDFEAGLEGWKLQLNRGAQVVVEPDGANPAHGKQSVRFDIGRLCAPDNQALPTNVHLRYEPVTLKPSVRYVFRVWVRAEKRRQFSLRVSRVADATTVADAYRTFNAEPTWRAFWFAFTTPPEATEARLQIVAGHNQIPLWIDDVVFEETDARCPLYPADLLWGEHVFLPKPAWTQERKDAWLQVALPADFSVATELQPGAGALPAVLFALEGSEEPLVLTLAPDRSQLLSDDRLLAEGPGLTGVGSSGRPLGVELLRFSDTLRLRQYGRTHFDAQVPGRIARVGLRGLATSQIVSFTGRELLPPERTANAKEAVTMKDPETGVVIHRLTHSARHDKHAYYDVCPWSPDGKRIVFSSALPGERTSQIFVMDADGSNMRVVADDGTFGMHTGAFTQWGADGETVYYTTRTDDGAALACVSLRTRDKKILSKPSRMISPDGKRSLFLEGDINGGLGIMNTDGTDAHIIVKWDDAIALSPSQDQIKKKPPRFTNCKWSPNGDRILFGITNEYMRPRTVKELFTVNPDGSDLRWLCPYEHHHIWSRDGSQVLFNGKGGMMLINADGTGLHQVCDFSVGHPSFSPDGRFIVTDSYRGKLPACLVLINAATGEYRKLVNVPTTLGFTHQGTHPHPCWSPDGSQILYDSDQSGTCQIYVLDVPEWDELAKTQ